MLKRYALVTTTSDRDNVQAYLPANYHVVWTGEHPDVTEGLHGRVGWKATVIAGRDNAGWTLDGYVIPRLASGLISAKEIDLSHPIMKLVPERPNRVPEDAVLVELPYSEVCVHMQVAGKQMWVEPVPHGMAQLYTLDGQKFSFPITSGEAGLHLR